jgi:hypothetical protein
MRIAYATRRALSRRAEVALKPKTQAVVEMMPVAITEVEVIRE